MPDDSDRIERLEVHQRHLNEDIETLEKALQAVTAAGEEFGKAISRLEEEFGKAISRLEEALRAAGLYLRETVGKQTFMDDKGRIVWFPENPLLFPENPEHSSGVKISEHSPGVLQSQINLPVHHEDVPKSIWADLEVPASEYSSGEWTKLSRSNQGNPIEVPSSDGSGVLRVDYGDWDSGAGIPYADFGKEFATSDQESETTE